MNHGELAATELLTNWQFSFDENYILPLVASGFYLGKLENTFSLIVYIEV